MYDVILDDGTGQLRTRGGRGAAQRGVAAGKDDGLGTAAQGERGSQCKSETFHEDLR